MKGRRGMLTGAFGEWLMKKYHELIGLRRSLRTFEKDNKQTNV